MKVNVDGLLLAFSISGVVLAIPSPQGETGTALEKRAPILNTLIGGGLSLIGNMGRRRRLEKEEKKQDKKVDKQIKDERDYQLSVFAKQNEASDLQAFDSQQCVAYSSQASQLQAGITTRDLCNGCCTASAPIKEQVGCRAICQSFYSQEYVMLDKQISDLKVAKAQRKQEEKLKQQQAELLAQQQGQQAAAAQPAPGQSSQSQSLAPAPQAQTQGQMAQGQFPESPQAQFAATDTTAGGLPNSAQTSGYQESSWTDPSTTDQMGSDSYPPMGGTQPSDGGNPQFDASQQNVGANPQSQGGQQIDQNVQQQGGQQTSNENVQSQTNQQPNVDKNAQPQTGQQPNVDQNAQPQTGQQPSTDQTAQPQAGQQSGGLQPIGYFDPNTGNWQLQGYYNPQTGQMQAEDGSGQAQGLTPQDPNAPASGVAPVMSSTTSSAPATPQTSQPAAGQPAPGPAAALADPAAAAAQAAASPATTTPATPATTPSASPTDPEVAAEESTLAAAQAKQAAIEAYETRRLKETSYIDQCAGRRDAITGIPSHNACLPCCAELDARHQAGPEKIWLEATDYEAPHSIHTCNDRCPGATPEEQENNRKIVENHNKEMARIAEDKAEAERHAAEAAAKVERRKKKKGRKNDD